jgi:hypothetical protein
MEIFDRDAHAVNDRNLGIFFSCSQRGWGQDYPRTDPAPGNFQVEKTGTAPFPTPIWTKFSSRSRWLKHVVVLTSICVIKH